MVLLAVYFAGGATMTVNGRLEKYVEQRPEFYLQGTNVLYELHATLATDAAWDNSFGFLSNSAPVLVAS